jgi:hypothetical protein
MFRHEASSRTQGGEEQIFISFNDYATQEQGQWEDDGSTVTHKASTKRNSRSYTARMSRQKSRRRELLGRHTKPGITVDTSFTRHRGSAPHQVFPSDNERSGDSARKSPWFGLGRSSTRNKGLGITKGTPQPQVVHRAKPSVDRNDLTAISLASGNKPWEDASPWDQRIPIGLSVPTNSVSDFSSFRAQRQRAGSDATLVTPSIIITPAAAMQSVWSPDTPFTESDYTPSVYSRQPFNPTHADIPPVPALPTELSKSSHTAANSHKGQAISGHSRTDTLDSAGTAFEEYDDSARKDRIMSSGTVFEEDETPLRERTIETSLAIDTSTVPTPRRSQGWWNVITTPFVTTPNTATWNHNMRVEERTPDIPTMPTQFDANNDNIEARKAPVLKASGTTLADAAKNQTPLTGGAIEAGSAPQPLTSSASAIAVAQHATSLPRQVDEQPRQININIELQDRRPLVNNTMDLHQFQTVPLTPQSKNMTLPAHKTGNSSSQALPVFAPPPTTAFKTSHFSRDNMIGSRRVLARHNIWLRVLSVSDLASCSTMWR